jgi:DNA-binding CsgD family transcriptional regulator
MSGDPNIQPPGDGYADLLTMARFLVMPGATQLLDAFSRIPPGPLRVSVIQHAEVIAQTYAGAPVEQQMPDPLYVASQTSPVTQQPALPKPTREPKTDEERIVTRLAAGESPAEIGKALGVSRQKVQAIRADAKKGGVKLPKLKADGSPAFATTPDELSPQGRSNMEIAANRRGKTLQQWLDARATFVKMRLAKTPLDEISVALGIEEPILANWLYTARRAGIDLPLFMDYSDAEVEPVKATPKRQVTPYVYPVFTPLADLGKGATAGFLKWATQRGWTPQEMFDKREEVVRRRIGGEGPNSIAYEMGVDMDFVKNACANATQKGIVFPPAVLPKRGAAHKVARNLHVALGAPVEKTRAISRDNVVRPKRWFGAFADLKYGAKSGAIAAAKARNMTPEAYLDLQENIVQQRMAGVGPSEIVQMTGEKEFFVRDVLKRARAGGADFPPVLHEPKVSYG